MFLKDLVPVSLQDTEVYDDNVIRSHKDARLSLQPLRVPGHYVSTGFSDNQSVTSQVKIGCIQTHTPTQSALK
jgi:hypothetical protein